MPDEMIPPPRDYRSLRVEPAGDELTTMQRVADALWDAFHAEGYSWVGFYVGPGRSNGEAEAGPEEMLLGPRRNKPACSPIGLQGVCGQAYRKKRPIVVRDVATLGENYIACDPNDRSEVVVPLFDEGGEVYGVLDVDSHEVGSFTQYDAIELNGLLERVGLSRPPKPAPAILQV